jgi:hypothetical protein
MMSQAFLRTPIVACVAALAVAAGEASAQSTSDLAAFNALIVSPLGALPPSANDNGRALPDLTSGSIAYGRWRYDINDAIHHNLGATISHRIGASRTSVSLTGAYLSLSCDCAGWTSGGVSLNSRVVSLLAGPSTPATTSGHVDVQLMAGGARYSGDGHASAYSAAATVDVGGSVLLRGSSRLALSVIPGMGFGHLSSADETARGTRPVIGGAVSWRSRHGVALNVGAQRVVLSGGPTQFGVNIAWHAN